MRTIFLVDDDEDDQLIFIEALAEIDPSIKCETALNGIEALEKLQQTKEWPELIFLDINMPTLDGFQCLARIKQKKKLSGIPLVIFSTTALESTVLKAELSGADAFLTKPSELKLLDLKLRKILATDFSIPSQRIRIFSSSFFFS